MNVYKANIERASIDLQDPMLEVRNAMKVEVALYSNNKKAMNAIINFADMIIEWSIDRGYYPIEVEISNITSNSIICMIKTKIEIFWIRGTVEKIRVL